MADVERKKKTLRRQLTQRKTTDTLSKLARNTQKDFILGEESKRRKELKEMKENLWRNWRGKKQEKRIKEETGIQKKLEENLEKVEQLLE